MLNIKAQCSMFIAIKTEKLRNTNMLDKCRNITLAENSWQTSTLSLIDVSSQKLGTHAAERQR